jgi:dTDP-4-amino-4,6-dideoxygalactose transaminase
MNASPQRIPAIDLPAQYRALKPEIDEALRRVFERGQFILGPEVEALEQDVASLSRVPHAVGVASGTDALELALRACGIRPGDEVITTAFSFIATAEAIVAVGAVPVFADIDPATYNLDAGAAASCVTPKTRAIIPVHLYGHPAPMDRIMALASSHKLKVIEDCAQAIGAAFQGNPVGSFGDAGAFSFFPTKNLGAAGDAGMVVAKDARVADALRLLRAHGSREKYRHELLGRNSRLDELQAAVLRVKLRRLEQWTESRRSLAQQYAAAFSAPGVPGLGLPQERQGTRHVYHLYTIRHAQRDRIQAELVKQGIGHQIAYPIPLPAQPALAPWAGKDGQFPQAEQAAREVISLPLYPELTAGQLDQVVQAVFRALVPANT